MNPIVLVSGMKALEKVNWKKATITLAAVVAIVLIARYIKKWKAGQADKELLEQRMNYNDETLDASRLYFDPTWYVNSAELLHGHLTAEFLSGGGGWGGCNQQGVYDIMGNLKSDDDFKELSRCYGIRKVRSSRLSSWQEKDLVGSMSVCMTSGEIEKVREILRKNNIIVNF